MRRAGARVFQTERGRTDFAAGRPHAEFAPHAKVTRAHSEEAALRLDRTANNAYRYYYYTPIHTDTSSSYTHARTQVHTRAHTRAHTRTRTHAHRDNTVSRITSLVQRVYDCIDCIL